MLIALVLGAIALLPGCAPAASTGGFHSPNPASKLYAIRMAGETRDRTAIPQLVEQLDSDDPAVRVFAINALERITNQRLGYNPYVDEVDRRSAIEAWVDAVKSNRFAQGN